MLARLIIFIQCGFEGTRMDITKSLQLSLLSSSDDDDDVFYDSVCVVAVATVTKRKKIKGKKDYFGCKNIIILENSTVSSDFSMNCKIMNFVLILE